MISQMFGPTAQKLYVVVSHQIQRQMGQGIFFSNEKIVDRIVYERKWLNVDELTDIYDTKVEYHCINGSQFVVEGGPNLTVEIR